MDKQIENENVKIRLYNYYTKWLEEIMNQGYFYNKDNYSSKFNPDDNGNDFSHPYFCGVPDNWFNSDIRLMICGEEGNGEIGKNTNIENNNFIATMQSHNLGFIDGNRKWNINDDNGAFANRFKQIADKTNYPNKTISVIWNECDKICRIQRKGNNGALTKTESQILHGRKSFNGKKLSSDILYEEIKLLKPTHIVFLGWHYASLGIDDKNYNNPNFPSYDSHKTEFIDKIKDNYKSPALNTSMPYLPEIKVSYINHPSNYNRLTDEAKCMYDLDIQSIIEYIKG